MSGILSDVHDHARELELELIRVRSQAEAARLNARAAELELLLRRLLRDDCALPCALPTNFSSDPLSPDQPSSRPMPAPNVMPVSCPTRGPDAVLSVTSGVIISEAVASEAVASEAVEHACQANPVDAWTQRMHRLQWRDRAGCEAPPHVAPPHVAPPREAALSETAPSDAAPSKAAPDEAASYKSFERLLPHATPAISASDWVPRIPPQALPVPSSSHDHRESRRDSQQETASHPWAGQTAATPSISGAANRRHVSPSSATSTTAATTNTLASTTTEGSTTAASTTAASSGDTWHRQDAYQRGSQPPVLGRRNFARDRSTRDDSDCTLASSPNPLTDTIATLPAADAKVRALPSLGSVLPAPMPRVSAHASSAARPAMFGAPTQSLSTMVSGDDNGVKAKRVRPASWLVSMVVHLAILLLLGVMTLASTTPKDQIAFAASASEPAEEPIETFTIESAQPAESEPPTAEPVYAVSDVGTMMIKDVDVDISVAPALISASELLDGSQSADRLMLKSSSQESVSKMQFCGVDGGGNHFIYLVDSSGSMKDGFYSARTELLASIDQLQPHQRFYVVFFDEEPEYMRIADPDRDEPVSVMATPENKQRLRKWAMKVQMNPGKAPYDVLPFALRLRPDVIFLLSDGEFPAKIEDILKAQNHQDNLFGDSGPICVVHTIRYHGVEGETGRKAEATMIKIATENGGQYRHVSKPR